MFRTRDFILFFTTIVFLVSAIGITLIKQSGTEARHSVLLPETSEEITEIDAVLVDAGEPTLDRESQLERIKRKIAESGVITYSQPVEEEFSDEVKNPEEIGEELDGSIDRTVQYCANYVPGSTVVWDAGTIEIREIEGIRQYFTTETVEVASTTSSSTDQVLKKNIKLQLPVKFAPTGSQACLANDVIGISLGGTLIKNTDVNLYSLFSSNTLIGYALDGFPIYGKGSSTLDQCGGVLVNGQYRYQLSEEINFIISCFADQPQQL